MLGTEMLYNQVTLDDEMAQRWFYGGYTLYLAAIGAFAIIAGVYRENRILFTASACFLAVMLGLVSMVFPRKISSLGYLGGGLLMLWAGAFALLTRVTGPHE